MSRKEALQALLSKVEAGDALFSSLLPIEHERLWVKYYTAFSGSLDAAKALHEALLPGWCWMKGYSAMGDGSHSVTVYLPAEDDADWRGETANSASPARAWLAAILKALIAEADQ